jgi:GH15 family glucan-1,4-alpha-glucosidase
MAEYNLEAKEYKKAMENFAFVTNSCSDHGLLGEQVNNETMKPEWVIGLTWSHAMYVIVLEMLIEKGLL